MPVISQPAGAREGAGMIPPAQSRPAGTPVFGADDLFNGGAFGIVVLLVT